MDLKTCGKPGCAPVEQTRGQMGNGDYALYVGSWRMTGDVPADLLKSLHALQLGPTGNAEADAAGHERYHEFVELNDDNRNDIRIFCKACGKASGWNKRDVPGMPGVGSDFIRKRWNDSVG